MRSARLLCNVAFCMAVTAGQFCYAQMKRDLNQTKCSFTDEC